LLWRSLNDQFTGTVAYDYKKFRASLENDVFVGLGEARFRSNAYELGFGKDVFGGHVYINDP
jgi:hypothetical protein